MTISQLDLFNGALLLLGERKLASLSEAREPQRVLTQVWNEGKGATRAMLEKGLWKFAIRSSLMTYSPSITPSFGYQFAFNKQSDHVRTAAVCTDPYFNQPLTQYDDESGYLYCDFSTIYVKWVSDDPSYGNNLSLWTQAFIEYFEHFLAWRSAFRITLNKEKEADMAKKMETAGIKARSLDAMDGPAKFMPTGTWVSARRGRFVQRNRENQSGSW
jgi:hypothetical protein